MTAVAAVSQNAQEFELRQAARHAASPRRRHLRQTDVTERRQARQQGDGRDDECERVERRRHRKRVLENLRRNSLDGGLVGDPDDLWPNRLSWPRSVAKPRSAQPSIRTSPAACRASAASAHRCRSATVPSDCRNREKRRRLLRARSRPAVGIVELDPRARSRRRASCSLTSTPSPRFTSSQASANWASIGKWIAKVSWAVMPTSRWASRKPGRSFSLAGNTAATSGPLRQPRFDPLRFRGARRFEIDFLASRPSSQCAKVWRKPATMPPTPTLVAKRQQQRRQGQRQPGKLLPAVRPEPSAPAARPRFAKTQGAREQDRQQQRGADQHAGHHRETGIEASAPNIRGAAPPRPRPRKQRAGAKNAVAPAATRRVARRPAPAG